MQINSLNQSPVLSSNSLRVQEIAYQSHEKLEIAYQDANGQAFNLSIERDVSYYSATYDRGGQMGNRPDALRKDLLETLRDAEGAVRGFRRLLHRLLRAVDKTYGDSFAGSEASDSIAGGSSQVVSVSQQALSISMSAVDPDYWSVDKTAGRIADFAVSLYSGGDRQAHRNKMEKAMEEGYRQAADAFRGQLPDIARKTIEAARKLLSDWARSAKDQAVVAPPAQRLDLAA
jgi:hypothetical protein